MKNMKILMVCTGNICRSQMAEGIARALHHAALAALRPAVAFLEVRASNHAAQALYADLGYRVSGRRRAYNPNPDGSREDALVLRWQAAPTE